MTAKAYFIWLEATLNHRWIEMVKGFSICKCPNANEPVDVEKASQFNSI